MEMNFKIKIQLDCRDVKTIENEFEFEKEIGIQNVI